MRPQVTLRRLEEMKAGHEPIVMVTAYDYPTARVAERAEVDMVLVGDSGAQVVLGYDSTVAVSIDEMLVLARAVRRGVRSAFVVCDLPSARPRCRTSRPSRRRCGSSGRRGPTPSSSRAAARRG